MDLVGGGPRGGGREAEFFDHESASFPAFEVVVGAGVDFGDDLGEGIAEFRHGEHVVPDEVLFLGFEVVSGFDELVFFFE